VVGFAEVLNGDLQVDKKTVVIGGGPTGCEVALHLSEHGCPVTIVEMLPKIGARLEPMTRKILLNKLEENNVQVLAECRLSKVEDKGVILLDAEDKELFVEAQRVVVTIGNRPDNKLFDQIKPLGYELHQIGDCLEPRSARAAIYEGAVLGRAI
jgi:pyruvate/2-oxoglutarate dehydrogenase complex dihydrolipoamide dehydrogenase (E3) component